ncbi:MAG: ParB/RepB/Spo0J family partition protein [Acidithiobacillus sp.]|nr:ParB/RepB/Spo0J family partition protein [Acidithiobacillus sp.]
MSKRVALGRGLDALFSEARETGSLRQIPLDLIQRGRYQPRRRFDEQSLAELADSVRAEGVLQPILVRAIADGRYEILAGERRWRAAQMVGLTEIPALVREASDQQALAIGIIENIQREDLDPLEEAAALQRLLTEFSLSHEALAAALGRSRAAISNQLRLLRLDPELAPMLADGRLSAGHARALLSLSPQQQRQVAAQVLARRLNVRQTERLAQQWQKKERIRPMPDPNLTSAVLRLQNHLGMRVKLYARGAGGELRICWKNAGEAAELWKRLGLPQEEENFS